MLSREKIGNFAEFLVTHTNQTGRNGTNSQITPNQTVQQISSRHIPYVEFGLTQRKQRAKVFVVVTHLKKGDETSSLEAKLEGEKNLYCHFLSIATSRNRTPG